MKICFTHPRAVVLISKPQLKAGQILRKREFWAMSIWCGMDVAPSVHASCVLRWVHVTWYQAPPLKGVRIPGFEA
jgi:hypothetical protein